MFHCIRVIVILFAIQAADCINCVRRDCHPMHTMQLICRTGIAKDPCNMCYVCLKFMGESCAGVGDLEGVCAKGLYCNELAHKTGVCMPTQQERGSDDADDSGCHYKGQKSGTQEWECKM